MTSKKLSKEDWLAAGFRALSSEGPAAIKAEVLARKLGATKGSFYWHFADLPTFQNAMLTLWREKVASEIIEEVMAEPNKQNRLWLLAESAAVAPPEEFGGRNIEPAMRAWALGDEKVRTALGEVDTLRVGFIKQLLIDAGIDDPALPELIYGAYIGLDDLASKNHADIARSLEVLLGLVLRSRKAPQIKSPDSPSDQR